MMKIFIDVREQALKKCVHHESNDINWMNLYIGDIQVKNVEENNTKNIVVLERKTFSDLRSSLVDGRFSEQKKRICSSDFIQKGYIFEGNLDNETPEFQNIIRQLSIRIQFKDKMSLFFTGCVQDTLDLICEMKRKLCIDKKLYTISDTINYVESLHVCKKNNLTPYVCFILQLSQIPGISKSSAKIICNSYKNWKELIEGLQQKDQFLLNTRQAKIGVKKFEQLYNYVVSGSLPSSVSS